MAARSSFLLVVALMFRETMATTAAGARVLAAGNATEPAAKLAEAATITFRPSSYVNQANGTFEEDDGRPVAMIQKPWRKYALNVINRERRRRGMPQLCINNKLSSVAQKHSRFMRRFGDITHIGPGSMHVTDRIDAGNYNWGGAGENVAWAPRQIRTVHDLFMGSPGHAANVLNPNFKHIGLGRARDKPSEMWYWTQVYSTPWEYGRSEGCPY